MQTSPLHSEFGLIVEDVDLRDVTADHLWPEIRHAFETHSALLFRNQDFDDDSHLRIANLFGPLENRDAMAKGKDLPFEIPRVTNETKDGVSDANALHTLNLQANFLWHTDSTFLPLPALVNILTARVVPKSGGGQTELASTRAGWATMPAHLKEQFQDAVIWHRLSNSRDRISRELGALPEMRQWPDRPWKAIWQNPVTKEDALYIASHSFAIEGIGFEDGQAIIDEAIEHCTKPEHVYSHEWQVGDVLLWDERCMLHRGQPWNYEEPRTLSSICCSVTEKDGFSTVRIV